MNDVVKRNVTSAWMTTGWLGKVGDAVGARGGCGHGECGGACVGKGGRSSDFVLFGATARAARVLIMYNFAINLTFKP